MTAVVGGSPYPPEMGPTPAPSAAPGDEAKQRRERTVRRLAIFLGVLLAVCMLVVTTFGVVLIRTSQAKNSPVLKAIQDCTQVTGKCYKQGQQRQAAVLGSVQRIIILSAACSIDVAPGGQSLDQRIAAISACVTTRLTKP